MKIGIVTTWFERGAAMVSRAYREALARQHEVFIYARGGESYAVGDPAWDKPYVTWGRRAQDVTRTAVGWRDFETWTSRLKLDAVIFNEQNYWPTVVLARRRLLIPIGAYVDYYTARTAPFFELYDFLLCNTKRHHSVFQRHRNALHIPWGTDTSLFSGTCERADPENVVFFHSAGMNPARKGTVLALQAFRKLSGKVRFVLHQQAALEKFPDVEQCVKSDPRVEVVNDTVPAPGLYHRGDIYVYPTLLEGIGLTIAEALSCGLPVVTTDAPPMSEFVSAECGRLVKPAEQRSRADGYYWPESYCDADSIAQAMSYYVENAPRLTEFKQAARAHALRHLDWNMNAKDLPSKLEGVIKSGRAHLDLCNLENAALDQAALPTLPLMVRALGRKLGMERHETIVRLVYG